MATRHTYVFFRATIALQLLSTGGQPRAICYNYIYIYIYTYKYMYIDWDATCCSYTKKPAMTEDNQPRISSKLFLTPEGKPYRPLKPITPKQGNQMEDLRGPRERAGGEEAHGEASRCEGTPFVVSNLSAFPFLLSDSPLNSLALLVPPKHVTTCTFQSHSNSPYRDTAQDYSQDQRVCCNEHIVSWILACAFFIRLSKEECSRKSARTNNE